jgi:hypothetical protein
MSSTLLIILGVLMGGWAFLSVLGNERQRLVQDREREHSKSGNVDGKTPEPPVGR